MNPFKMLTALLDPRNTYDALCQWRRQGATKVRSRGLLTLWETTEDGQIKNWIQGKNGTTTAGINSALDVVFRAQAQITAWYVGLIDSAGYSGVSASDTMSSHAGWSEFTGYSGANRATWSPAAASGGVIANSSSFSYSITSSTTINGGFVASSQAKSASTGTLWATALQTRAVTNGSTLNGTYSYTLTPSS